MSQAITLFHTFPFLPYNHEFQLGLFAFALSLLFSAFYFWDWLHYHKGARNHVTLFWGAGLFFSSWFQIPFLIANAGLPFSVPDYHPLFVIVLSISFAGTVLLYRSIRMLAKPDAAKIDGYLVSWAALYAIFLSYRFYSLGGTVSSSLPIIAATFIFNIPLFVLILVALLRWYGVMTWKASPCTGLGIVFFTGAILFRIGVAVFSVITMLRYSPELWFIAIMAPTTRFAVHAVSIILLIAALLCIHCGQLKHKK